MSPHHHAAFTRTEAIVSLVLLVVVGFLTSFAFINGALTRGRMTSQLSNMKQLQLATTQMALDGVSTKDTNLGWPGDTGGTYSNWTAQLLSGQYLSTNDLCKLLSAYGSNVPSGLVPPMNKTGVLVYAISTNSPSDAIFLTSANYTATLTGGLLNRSAKPYGDEGFVVFYKKGQGAILRASQAGKTNIVGSYVPLCR